MYFRFCGWRHDFTLWQEIKNANRHLLKLLTTETPWAKFEVHEYLVDDITIILKSERMIMSLT